MRSAKTTALLIVVTSCWACSSDKPSQDSPPEDADSGTVTQPMPDASASIDAAGAADAGSAPDAAMGPDAAQATDTGVTPIRILGAGTHNTSMVDMNAIGTAADGLAQPRDLAFNPAVETQLWVINRRDESMVIFLNPGTPSQTALKRHRPESHHFLAQPAALAFGATGTFATIHETDRPTQGSLTPPDFMGPTLWTSDINIFEAGDPSHYGMLHNSPNGMGIAWERDNIYWVFDGAHSSISRYDFHAGHALGGSDHSNGDLLRYAAGQVQRVANVPSHMKFDPATRQLYIADTGNNRIAVLDTRQGVRGGTIAPNYDGDQQHMVTGVQLQTLVDGAAAELRKPCGLALRDGAIYVADNESSRVVAFGMDGHVLDWLDTGLPAGSLMGLTFDSAGRMYLTDAAADRVLRVVPR